MNKILTAALGAALVVASAASAAAETQGAFFINAAVGQAQYQVGRSAGQGNSVDDKDTAGALRFGYAWNVGNGFNLGVEGGYADLGKVVARYSYSDGSTIRTGVHAKGWLLGGNAKYNFAGPWYATARAGWFRSEADASYRYSEPGYTEYASGSAHGDGWYGGVGVGYDFAPNFSLGLNYDNYHAKARYNQASIGGNVGTYMLTAEYRF
ncbi:outer membrane beta-barrel protein [Rhodanobacter denitrificans]|uniref:outer membrane beta-barrel protein n=1 Tax=Rhodanobacter denitrificans TaxID=666685 RepID=UPI001F48AC9E|nr:outer membrane beta-barrel protein [Rhodanobacter denitrificans]UJJ57461.1 outer membrane beta-barrel protein [Rhodanobacter denitrificans]